MNFNLAPLSTSFLGFDRLFGDMERMLSNTPVVQNSAHPPLNLYKEEDGYSIELALAGYKKSDIKIEHDRKRGILSVSGESNRSSQMDKAMKFDVSENRELTAEPEGRRIVKQGIATRKFSRMFTIADDLEVQSAELVDGLLTIRLHQVVREEDQPLRIELK